MKKILFLGYDTTETKIINQIKNNKNIKVFHTKRKIETLDLMNIDLLISFGYRHIIDEEILKRKNNILNLHISYIIIIS